MRVAKQYAGVRRMPSAVRRLNVEPTSLAVVRRRARPSELGTVVPRCCGIVWDFARSHGMKAGRHVAVYLNTAIDVEIGVELNEAFVSDGAVVASSLPGGAVATAVHLGPYHLLGDTHKQVLAWIEAHDLRATGICWEIYDHWRVEWDQNPSQIRTDVFYQLTGS